MGCGFAMVLLSQSSTGPDRRWVFTAYWHQNQNACLPQKSLFLEWLVHKPSYCWSTRGFRGDIFPVTLGYPGPGTNTADSPVSLWALEPCLATEVRETLPGAASYAPKTRLLTAGGHCNGPDYLSELDTPRTLSGGRSQAVHGP